MKRALAERAKQSGLPNGVTAVHVNGNDAASSLMASSVPTNGTHISEAAVNGPAAPPPSVPTHVPADGATSQQHPSPPLQFPKVEIPRSSPPPLAPPAMAAPTTSLTNATDSGTNTNHSVGLAETVNISIQHADATPGSLPPSQQQLQQQHEQQHEQQQQTQPPTPSPRPKKRQREPIVKLEEEDEDDSNASAFFLRHQNRALASELRSVKYQMSRLEQERDHRRTQCREALQNLNSLQAIWTQLEVALQNVNPPNATATATTTATTDLSPEGDTTAPAPSSVPLSTGSGASVELVDALMTSLSRLASQRGRLRDKEDGQNILQEEKKNSHGNDADKMDVVLPDESSAETPLAVEDLSHLSGNVSDRAAALRSWIWSLLERVKDSRGVEGIAYWSPPSSLELQEQLTQLQSKNTTLQEELNELARSRDEIVESDRRVRRGLYRLAAGRMELKEVLKAISGADEDKEKAAAWMESSNLLSSGGGGSGTSSPTTLPSASASAADGKVKAEKDAGNSSLPVSLDEVQNLKKQLVDLQDVASARDEQIQKLLMEREGQLKRINSLVLQDDKPGGEIPTNEVVELSDLYLEQSARLATSKRKFDELNEHTSRMKDEWAQALADAEASKNAMEDMQTKHLKRWAELAEDFPDIGPEDGDGSLPGNKAELIATLQHKLTQALENVRQAEATRKTLNEAVSMNASLQAKVEEFKSKYNALQAEKAARMNSQSGSNGTSKDASVAPSGESKPSPAQPAEKVDRSDRSDKTDRSTDKLHRDYKRARKDLAAAISSKEAAKAKLERTEKDREFLNQMNSRLLKQASEKDEINAKSLSTILHLKQLTEQISKEKDNLEQQVKSAEQLALAARLASNARERVAEEFEKERKQLEAQVKEWEEKCVAMVKEKELAEGRLIQEKARMSSLINDAQKAKERCEELASESTKLQEEKQKMAESLAVAQREASDAANLSQRLSESCGGGMVAGFTAEQLHTQVNVLKSRLACPVCNARDKKCILLRCRHMFCKQCVDESIKNRSRKCPACGVRFDTKDVADVWL